MTSLVNARNTHGYEDRLEVGDVVILFVQEQHVPTVQLLFPGREPGQSGAARG